MSITKTTEKLMDVEEFLEKHADKLADLTRVQNPPEPTAEQRKVEEDLVTLARSLLRGESV